jgi:hypothetical protein
LFCFLGPLCGVFHFLAQRPLQADHLADSKDQQREEHQDHEEIFQAVTARLFELLVEIKVQSVVHAWRVRLPATSAQRLA